jgi:hypothetical protein
MITRRLKSYTPGRAAGALAAACHHDPAVASIRWIRSPPVSV